MAEGKNLVGVDIGSTSIKLCELKENRGGDRSLVRFGFHPLPPETVIDGSVMNSAAVVEGLEKLFHKAKRRDVALRASGHSVIIKKIQVPLMTPGELAEQIGWEAEQHIPFDLSEVHIDYQLLQKREQEGKMDVLLVAAKKDEINELKNLAIEARLRPRVVDLDAFTVQNVFELGYGMPSHSETVVLIHVGASLTTVNILAEGTTAFTRDITNGGKAITDELQRRLGATAQDAEAMKCGDASRGTVPAEVEDVMRQVVEQLAGEVQRSLDFFLATGGSREINRIYLSGGTANIPALREAVGRRSHAPTELLDPMRVVEQGQAVPAELAGRTSQAAVAFGLALRKDREQEQSV